MSGWTPVTPGWGKEEDSSSVVCVKECVAHIVASVQNVHDIMENGHVLVTAKCEHAFVRLPYWRSDDERNESSAWTGKAVFAPRKHEFRPSPPPILTFLGSKVFGHVGVVAV